MGFQWDENKADKNLKKHGIDFSDAVTLFDDFYAVTIDDPNHDEERFVTMGMDAYSRILVVVYIWRGNDIRLISARKATKHEHKHYKGWTMKDEYDFTKGKSGPVIPPDPNKVRITIRLDTDIVNYFKTQVHKAGGGNYQTMINNALREYLNKSQEHFDEDTLRRVIREELQATG